MELTDNEFSHIATDCYFKELIVIFRCLSISCYAKVRIGQIQRVKTSEKIISIWEDGKSIRLFIMRISNEV